MKEWLIGQGVIFYVFAGSLVIGLIAAFVANHGYKRLIKETELMANTENRLLKYIKLKFGSYYKLNMKPQDTRALAKHYMYKYKIGFMTAASWIKLSKLTAYVIGLAALVDMLLMLRAGRTVTDMVMMAATAAFAIGVLYMQHHLYNFDEKREMLEWHLMDYLENFLRNKIESGKNLQAMMTQEDTADKKAFTAGSSYGAAGKVRSGQGYGTSGTYENGRPSPGYGENARNTGYPDTARTANGYGGRTAGSYGSDPGVSRDPVPAYAAAGGEGTYAAASGSYGAANAAPTGRTPEGSPSPTDGRRGGKPTKGTDEAAAAKIQTPYSKAAYYDPFVKHPKEEPEDEVDAKIVEDILKEFLN